MDFDFHDQYAAYSNLELLKIIKQPDNYQDAAVEAAKTILATRNVSESDMHDAENDFQKEETEKQAKQEKSENYKNNLTDFLQDLSEPGSEVKPVKWLKVFLLILGIQYAYTFYITIKGFIFFISCDYCRLSVPIILQFIGLIYIPVIFFLLYKKHRWGWILLFADNLFAVLAGIFQVFIFFKYQSLHQGSTYGFLVPLLIRTIFSFFLWRDEITVFFGVNDETRKKTLLVTTAGTILFIGILYLQVLQAT